MSLSKATTDECKWCNEQITEWYAPGYCSEECYYKERGDRALNNLRHDHRFCASCGSKLKSIEPVPDEKKIKIEAPDHKNRPDEGEIRNTHIGYQYLTPNAEISEKEYHIDEYSSIIHTGTGCKCGNTDTRYIDKDLQEIELKETLVNYVKRFREIEREGQINQRITKDTFFRVFKTTGDLEYALGKALYGSSPE